MQHRWEQWDDRGDAFRVISDSLPNRSARSAAISWSTDDFGVTKRSSAELREQLTVTRRAVSATINLQEFTGFFTVSHYQRGNPDTTEEPFRETTGFRTTARAEPWIGRIDGGKD